MKEKNSLLKIIFVILTFGLLAAFAFYVNRGIVIKALYMDDLYTWSLYGEQSIREFVFPIGQSERFRPLFWLALYLMMKIIGTHVDWFVPCNIVLNILVASEVSFFAYRLSRKNVVVTLGAGLCYLASRFAYFQIAQALNGLLETMALAMSLAVLYDLLKYTRPAGLCQNLVTVSVSVTQDSASGTQRAGGSSWIDSGSEGAKKNQGRKMVGKTKDRADIRSRYFYIALIVWFLLVFVHERFLCLFPYFYLAHVMKHFGDKRGDRADSRSFATLPDGDRPKGRPAASVKTGISHWVLPALLLVFILGIRTWATGSLLPAGTGGTYVDETFDLSTAIGYALDQVLYIFGINAGPEYLCGIEWQDTSPMLKLGVIISIVFIGILLSIFVARLILDGVRLKSTAGGSKKEIAGFKLSDRYIVLIMFFGFIALCIGASSVTIRLEMRWIYVSYTAAILLASYMLGTLRPVWVEDGSKEQPIREGENKTFRYGQGSGLVRPKGSKTILRTRLLWLLASAAFSLYVVFSVCTNIYYRGYFHNLYFWTDQLRMNSLAEETIEKYGTDFVFGKNIYIIGNTYGMSEFYAATFFKPYDPEKKAQGTEVIFVGSLDEVPLGEVEAGEALVLIEVPEENAYRDISDSL